MVCEDPIDLVEAGADVREVPAQVAEHVDVLGAFAREDKRELPG